MLAVIASHESEIALAALTEPMGGSFGSPPSVVLNGAPSPGMWDSYAEGW